MFWKEKKIWKNWLQKKKKKTIDEICFYFWLIGVRIQFGEYEILNTLGKKERERTKEICIIRSFFFTIFFAFFKY